MQGVTLSVMPPKLSANIPLKNRSMPTQIPRNAREANQDVAGARRAHRVAGGECGKVALWVLVKPVREERLLSLACEAHHWW